MLTNGIVEKSGNFDIVVYVDRDTLILGDRIHYARPQNGVFVAPRFVTPHDAMCAMGRKTRTQYPY